MTTSPLPDRLLGLLAFLLAIPFLLIPNLPFFSHSPSMSAVQRLMVGVSMILFVFIPLWQEAYRRLYLALWRGFPPLAQWGILAFFLLGFLSALASRRPLDGVLGAGFFFLLFLFGLGIATATRVWQGRFLRLLGMLCTVAALLYSLRYLYAFMNNSLFIQGWFYPWELFSNFVNIRNFNEYQNATLFLVTLSWWTAGKERWGVGLVLVLWWMLFFLAGSRGAMLGVILVVVALVWLFRRGAWPWIRGMFILSLMGYAFFKILTLPGLFSEVRIYPTDFVARLNVEPVAEPIRLILWKAAWSMGWENPFLGVGPRQYAHVLFESLKMTTHPHNVVLQIWAEWGIPACLLFTGLGGWGTLAWLAWCRKQEPTPVLLAAASSLILVGVSAQVDTVLISVLGQTGFAVTMGILLGLKDTPAPVPQSHCPTV